ncbi:hypothetical protein M422DRAFT_36850 [Sphaerobolus stellatus SS14]|uniref:Uncharacterized protein n=1 Tax=Sphaerobolus stellatus (strain SS14) TaxID=990650 RepID=A0A0C9U6A7_SPHS4|nr:hypothetical protein M422DRAFT_36850 [Sphaerobolus stellatus SS14]
MGSPGQSPVTKHNINDRVLCDSTFQAYSSPPSLQIMNEQDDVSCLAPDSYTSGAFIPKIPRPSSIELARQRWREDGEEYLDAVKDEMVHAWKQDDCLLERFFSTRHSFHEKIQAAKERSYNSVTHRWSKFPTPLNYRQLCNRFRTLLNDILLYESRVILSRRGRGPPSQLKQRRCFYVTYKRNYFQSPLPRVVSSLYLAGSGPEFVTAKDKLRPAQSPVLGISPIEVLS